MFSLHYLKYKTKAPKLPIKIRKKQGYSRYPVNDLLKKIGFQEICRRFGTRI